MARLTAAAIDRAFEGAGLKIRLADGPKRRLLLTLPGRGHIVVGTPLPSDPDWVIPVTRLSAFTIEEWVEQAWIAQMRLLLEA